MPQVTVTIAGKAYRMACGEGEEAHLEKLAAMFDGKIDELRGAFGEIGDMRLHVMAALTIADELAEIKTRLARMETEKAALADVAGAGDAAIAAAEERVADAIGRAAERVERVSRALGPQQA
jgi:cell division protein ZapA